MSNKMSGVRILGTTLTVIALSLTACGTAGSSEDSTGGVARVGSDTTAQSQDLDATSGDSSDEVEAPTDPNEAFLRYDQCMAERGFPTDAAGQANQGPSMDQDRADDSGDDSGRTERMVGPGGIEIAPEDLEEFKAANQTCETHLANITQGEEFTPEQQAAMEDATLRVQQCMNDKGFDVHLSVAGDQGGLSRQGDGDEDPDPAQEPADPEALDQAMEECSKIYEEYPELAGVIPGSE